MRAEIPVQLPAVAGCELFQNGLRNLGFEVIGIREGMRAPVCKLYLKCIIRYLFPRQKNGEKSRLVLHVHRIAAVC